MAIPGAALIGGGEDLLGGLLGMGATKGMAREQMAFQERMSSTAWQRAVADMRLAGINPMLAFQQGGASSPGGAMAEMPNIAGPAVSSAQHARLLQKELQLKNQEIARANTALIKEGLEASVTKELYEDGTLANVHRQDLRRQVLENMVMAPVAGARS